MNKTLPLGAFVAILIGVLVAFGVFNRDAAEPQSPAPGEASYDSTELDLSFSYAERYEVTLRKDGNAEREWHTLLFMEKDYVAPVGGEGPPTITIQMFPNTEDLELESWVRSDGRSNFKLAAGEGSLSSTQVAGEPALAYRYSGLYETSVVVAAHGGNIYLFSAGWLTLADPILDDFEQILRSVQFTQQ